jgi:N-acyl-D-amino-acid deacylase
VHGADGCVRIRLCTTAGTCDQPAVHNAWTGIFGWTGFVTGAAAVLLGLAGLAARRWLVALIASSSTRPHFSTWVSAPVPSADLLIRRGVVYDGSGGPPVDGDVAIVRDSIAAVGELPDWSARDELDAPGLAVAPGFVNMLSWATESLLEDGRAQSDIRQGVTLEVMGEGFSMGPLTDRMKEEVEAQSLLGHPVEWTTLGEYLEHLERRGVSPNVASFVGSATVREHVIGADDRAPSETELAQMQQLVVDAMREGAVGLAAALIYAPAFYAQTDELIALARPAGMYITHLRSEGDALLEAFDEFLGIVRAAGVRGEIYHLKVAGEKNWPKLGRLIERVEAEQRAGLHVTADMYTYTAGATGLDGAMPPWVQAGGFEAWRGRLRDPDTRARVAAEMQQPTQGWENMFELAGPDKIKLLAFKNEQLRPLTGKTLAEVSAERGTPPAETAMDLVIEDGTRVGAAYFTMSEENLRREVALPWVSFCSDSDAPSAEGRFLQWSNHPRAYGSFARLLARYVRDEQVIALEEAVRRLTSLPAQNLRLQRRGLLEPGYFADVVVFDPARIQDHATYDEPHQYATGVEHVAVNGTLVLRDGEHTGALPGRVVRGPLWSGDSRPAS